MSNTDFFPIQDWDYLEFYVGNAKQAMHYFIKAFGFEAVAYAGLETGSREKVSYVLKQKHMTFVISGALTPDSPIADFAKKHGDGVKDVALRVDDCEQAYREAVSRGAIPIMEPTEYTDEFGTVKKAVIGTYGENVHSFIERKNYNGPFLPGYVAYQAPVTGESTGLIGIDHIVGNVEVMDEWVGYYQRVMGFTAVQNFSEDDISTEYSALMSKVMQSGTGRIKFPINEPAEGRRKSQIQEFLEFYQGPGVQHIAVLTNDIIETVSKLRDNGVDFLTVPDTYYEDLKERVGEIDEDIEALKKLGVLVDRDDEGYLLQLFSKPIVDRPTLFIEVIQRKGARGFGNGNFKALFEALEREQERRGNL
ncbi:MULTISPECIES: 4-hydroxyphenylpyruvate dioxygenase [Brevibacillus]|jgi:4-hydroxyphenylpyruvate dioxygenase|uniref:4-hydroxyphenylpyruvate dioxygenase n=1 Tax=Brevibacillus parabrevis TaxID=54914 RepID=A0A4Y3PI62_BREPA|nr:MULTISPECIES: 4-hydroxyphenylpyruvate dioxygenase [Brevibacillus]MBU8714510.1 4-hydroxyphenylpyruvate dioxygenase [Brevibacillus parabrevis]MDH6351268.1 4-hydroxyphenylpyruvate dioxygenase [Brevibacillus sp. 1238]MDR4998648.1 4-hydroxyphenylpyruvate dioxygenase [Brevibacillus parabrevis]MED1723513.1 4-hydroxyphenylpyruvate dioxygenase [Brevibacillus parabrevis]MED2254781.1 4-hydroxyphenylpyruvate dioxygenase [Brevibacillus parabrevis]